MWVGKLLAPIPGNEEETHCFHIQTPYKTVVFGMILADFLNYAVLAHELHVEEYGAVVNTEWLAQMGAMFRKAAQGDTND